MGIASLHPSYAPPADELSFVSRAKWLRSRGTAKSMKARTFGTVRHVDPAIEASVPQASVAAAPRRQDEVKVATFRLQDPQN